jgi:hypothetical protein
MRRLCVVTFVVTAVLTSAESASACSCVALKPKEQLAAAKAAFVGRVVEKKLVDDSVPIDKVFRYRIRIGRSLKRKLGNNLSLTARTNEGVCGFEWVTGELVAAYLYGRPGKWNTSLCDLERPGVMRRLARKLARKSLTSRAPHGSRSTCQAAQPAS